MINLVKEYSVDLFDLFFPNICVSCSQKLLRGENAICFRCENELPRTDHWTNLNNTLAKRFWGRVDIKAAAALYQFQKGSGVQHLLHQLKYRGRKDIGEYLGKIVGNNLKNNDTIFEKIEVIVPVPLHWKRLKMRGYNQCDSFASGISHVLNIPASIDSIERKNENISQTKKKRFDRWENVAEIFSVKNNKPLIGKHVLLVDDVVTTGATAEACLKTILTIENTKVSFIAIAAAR